MTDHETLPAERTADGKFLPGHSVRSGGMVGGAARAERVALYIEPHIKEVLDKTIELAKKGDPQSIRLILERFAPLAKQDAERVEIPGFADAKTLQEKADAVIAAAASGHCTAEAAARLLAVLRDYAQTITASDHERRLQAIEEGRNARVIEGSVIHDTFDPEDVG
jgi:hypothetical protein